MTTLAEFDKVDIEDPLQLDSIARSGIHSRVAMALGSASKSPKTAFPS